MPPRPHCFPPPAAAAVNDRQLSWAGSLAAVMQAAAAAKRAAAAAEEEAAAAAAAAASRLAALAERGTPRAGAPPGRLHVGLAGSAASTPRAGGAAPAAADVASPRSVTPVARPQARALGVFGRVWDFLIDEATYVETAEGAVCAGCCWAGAWVPMQAGCYGAALGLPAPPLQPLPSSIPAASPPAPPPRCRHRVARAAGGPASGGGGGGAAGRADAC